MLPLFRGVGYNVYMHIHLSYISASKFAWIINIISTYLFSDEGAEDDDGYEEIDEASKQYPSLVVGDKLDNNCIINKNNRLGYKFTKNNLLRLPSFLKYFMSFIYYDCHTHITIECLVRTFITLYSYMN